MFGDKTEYNRKGLMGHIFYNMLRGIGEDVINQKNAVIGFFSLKVLR
jgi:hypothetical protein